MASNLGSNHPMINPNRLIFLSFSNFPPTETESMYILELISAEQSRLVELDRALASATAPDFVQRLKWEHLKCASDLRKHKSIVMPIRRVPPELVREIFLRVLDLDFDFERICRDDYPVSPSCKKAPLLLGQICSTWRQICIEYPKLWNRIIVSEIVSSKKHDHTMNFAKMWLDRAQALPLSLVLPAGTQTTVEHLSNLMDVLLPYFPRCERLHINLVNGLLPCLKEFRQSMPVLDHLHVRFKTFSFEARRLLSQTRALREFVDAPHLKSVELSHDHLLDHLLTQTDIHILGIPWSRLTHLTINNNKFNPNLLLQCINLEQCRWDCSNSDEPFPTNSAKTILPHLQDLHLSAKDRLLVVSDILDLLTLPALRILSICDMADRSVPIDTFVTLQARSRFKLTSLSLEGLSFQSSNPRDLFLTIPSLVSLSLAYCSCSITVPQALTYSENDSDPLLPCLQELTIMDEGRFDPIFQLRDFLDMVESRWWPTNSLPDRPIARLRKVNIEVPRRASSSEYERIERLRERVVESNWWILPPNQPKRL